MSKIKNNLPIILVSLSSILFVVAILLLVNNNIFKSSNNVNSNDTNSKDTKEIQNKDIEEKESKNQEIKKNNDEKVEPTSTPTQKTVEPKSEEAVINFFQSKENEVQTGDEKTFGEKAKDAFVTIVDFIFYDKEVKGYTFKELTTSAKIKIITIALKIDNKIDSYFPNYKDKIKGTYTNIKDKLVEKYLEYSNKLCETIGVEKCNEVKKDWEIVKEKFGVTTEYLKKLGITGSEKLKNWYENFRDK